MTLFRSIAQRAALTAAAVLSLAAQAQHAGLRTLTVGTDAPMTVALFYPTEVPARAVSMGPWQVVVTPGAPAAPGPLKGLILLSHGTGGMELNHHNLATRLAREGYLVAAVRHPGDNFQDRSMLGTGNYLSERPRQLSRVLDALLASPEWAPRIPAGRIGALGHSAGGYSVLALAGGQAEGQRSAQHCRTVQDDPGFCGLAKSPTGTPPPAPATTAAPVAVADPRIRAVFATAPMAVVFTPESLAAIRVPVAVLMAEQDTVLNGKYHGARVVAALPQAQAGIVPGAGHFAFMAQPVSALPSAAGDAAANPPGFDRLAYLSALEDQVSQFFAAQLR